MCGVAGVIQANSKNQVESVVRTMHHRGPDDSGLYSEEFISMGIARLVEATGALPHDLRESVRSFFASHPVPEAERAITKALEAIDLRHRMVMREQAAFSQWLKGRMSQAA